MRQFASYVSNLENLLRSVVASGSGAGWESAIAAALDGGPAGELRRVVPLETMRSVGAFFTGSKLARCALRSALKTICADSTILDPSCGAGDLLVACARHLPTASSLARTLSLWGRHVIGRDLQPEFIRAAKIRLALTAIGRGVPTGKASLSNCEKIFPHIETRCGLSDHNALAAASHIVVNPPFTLVGAPEGCIWAAGKVNSAALFVQACLLNAKPGARIVAILPDVLRSGTRYRKWRELVESHCSVRRIAVYGQFDRWADVDVFILDAHISKPRKNQRSIQWQYPVDASKERLSDRFSVSVGPVVSYRDPHRGPWFPFVISRNLPAWQTVTHIPRHRRFSGRTLEPPLVVVRRTSRPGDKYRAVGTIIACKKPVAVENHLLVLQPHDGKVDTCTPLLSVLRNRRTNTWLDQRIRCRHLTVSSLRELPWWGANQ